MIKNSINLLVIQLFLRDTNIVSREIRKEIEKEKEIREYRIISQ